MQRDLPMTLDNFGPSDPLGSMGLQAISLLQMVAKMPGANNSVVRDWSAIESWLGCHGRPLGPSDLAKISAAYSVHVLENSGKYPIFAPLASSRLADLRHARDGMALLAVPPNIKAVFARICGDGEFPGGSGRK